MKLFFLAGLFAFSFMSNAMSSSINGPIWRFESNEIDVEGVESLLREPSKVLFTQWELTEMRYVLGYGDVKIVAYEGRGGVYDLADHDAKVVVLADHFTSDAKVTMLICHKGDDYILGLHLLALQRPLSPDKGGNSVYFSVKATSVDKLFMGIEKLLSGSRFRFRSPEVGDVLDASVFEFISEQRVSIDSNKGQVKSDRQAEQGTPAPR